MDKKIANNIVVGLFVFGGVAAFIYILFTIGDGKGLFSSQYTLLAKFSDVKGLHEGSEVSLSGLSIGVVKGIEVSAGAKKELIVKLSIAKNMKDRIRQDSAAVIRTQGVLGDKYIEISIGSLHLPELNEGDMLKSEEVQDLFTKSGNMIEGISKQFDKGGDFESLIKNLNRLASNLVVLTSDLKTKHGLFQEVVYGDSGQKMNKAMGHLEDILKKIDNGDGTIGALINDPTLYEDVKYMMGGAKRSSILKYFMKSFIESGEKAEPKEKPAEKPKK